MVSAMGLAGINRPYEDSGYVISDPASWDTNAGKDNANTVELQSDDTKGPYDTSTQLLSSPGNEKHVINENSTKADTPLEAGLETERAIMEARGKTFGGKLEEENNKCRALNKLGNHGKDYTDQNGSEKKPIGCRT